MNAPPEEAEAHARVSKRENRIYVGNLSYDCNYRDLKKFMMGGAYCSGSGMGCGQSLGLGCGSGFGLDSGLMVGSRRRIEVGSRLRAGRRTRRGMGRRTGLGLGRHLEKDGCLVTGRMEDGSVDCLAHEDGERMGRWIPG